MEIEKFKNNYTPLMMEIVKKFDEEKSFELSNIIMGKDYTQLQKVKHQLELLQSAKMLIHEYPENI